ncbi:sensor histidine kinase [Poritiphilus flavus]|uniref:Oxygen sensor histidine kinase NreB n=1 Tax=Poritiphilus flavus TaxID=2697053 RepID=A0A6L9EHY0_9FLAO|nr:sensor histidine kinase [Poritiphilus flavus]NAS14293.1 hypothetical protein [Poritiphilus flavus]
MFLILGAFVSGAQNPSALIDRFRFYELDTVSINLDQYHQDEKQLILWRLDFLKEYDISSGRHDEILNFEASKLPTSLARFLYYLNYGDYLFYKHDDSNTEAKDAYVSALDIALEKKDKKLICEALKGLLSLNRQSYLLRNNTASPYLQLYEQHKYDELEDITYTYYKLIFDFQYIEVERWDKNTAQKLLDFAKSSPHHMINGKIFYLLDSYAEAQGDFGGASSLSKLALEEFKKIPYKFASTQIKNTYISLARNYVLDKDFKNAQYALDQIDTDHRNNLEKENYRFVYYYQALIDSVNRDFNNAFNNLRIHNYESEIVLDARNKKLFDELEAKYQNVKKEQENQVLQANIRKEQREKQYLLLGTAAVVLFGGLIAMLLYQNKAKKQKLAEQEKLLEQQKVENLLKEQELINIDAMITGQEKERQRVANELHDDLGSLMATVRLHFDNIQGDREDPALRKAQKLLEEAYEKIRGIAHSKNSGVMANQGLLPAVQKMAHTISGTNALEVTVEDYGMEERMENSLELAIFRMIQELVANIIKHAKATRASIQFTQHEDNLNIIVEDNGVGFKGSSFGAFKSGMGLSSIEKRVEFLEGSFTVDSVPGKGTSILIDIPV